jgi:hypothetical protein
MTLSSNAQISFTQSSNTFGNMTNIIDIDTGDVDGDNDIDVIIMGNNGTSDVTEIYLNDGSGNYSILSGTSLPFYAFGGRVKLIDIEGDNDMDVIMVGFNITPSVETKAELYRNDGSGTFTLVAGTPFVGTYNGSIVVDDVDGDNDMDIIIAGEVLGFESQTNRNNLYKNDGSGNFTKTNLITTEHTSTQMKLADIDNDNDLDLFIIGNNGNFNYFENDGSGNFTSTAVSGLITFGGNPRIELLDIDGDNVLELFIAGSSSTTLYTYGGKDMVSLQPIYTPITGTSFITSDFSTTNLAVGDFDGDNDEDIYLVSSSDGGATLTGGFYFNDGAGNFYFDSSISFDYRLGKAIPANMIGDSKVDLLTGGSDGANNNLRLNTNTSPGARALTMDGTNYYTAPHLSALNTFPITIEFKIKVPSTSKNDGILVKDDVTSGIRIRVDQGGEIRTFYYNSAGSADNLFLISNASIYDNNWHHVAIVWESSGATMYIDGVQDNTASWTGGTPIAIANTDNLIIGDFPDVSGNVLAGGLDELRIWNTVRSVTEIVNNMCSEISSPSTNANLVAYYRMNEFYDNTKFIDYSSNTNTMTISGGSLATEAEQTGCSAPALPVELTAFNGRLIQNEVFLNWQTASEQSNDGFEIQRAVGSNLDWQTIGFEMGNGTTTEVSNYEFIDQQPATGVNYYRLKQIDYDGQFEYSKIIQLATGNSQPATRIFPNPANDFLTIEINEPTTFQIVNAQGQVVMERSLSNTERIDISHLSAGIYWVNILNNNTSTSQSLVIQ